MFHSTAVIITLHGASVELVTRYMLERWREQFRRKTIGLLLIASPLIGSQYANFVNKVVNILQHETGRQLQWKSPELVDLDRPFRDMLDQKLIPDLIGRERASIAFYLKQIARADFEVPATSRGVRFGRAVLWRSAPSAKH